MSYIFLLKSLLSCKKSTKIIRNIKISFWTEICLRKLRGRYNMGNFCINCGAKLEKDFNFCINCGTKVDKSQPKQGNPSRNSVSHQYEKERAKKEVKIIMG